MSTILPINRKFLGAFYRQRCKENTWISRHSSGWACLYTGTLTEYKTLFRKSYANCSCVAMDMKTTLLRCWMKYCCWQAVSSGARAAHRAISTHKSRMLQSISVRIIMKDQHWRLRSITSYEYDMVYPQFQTAGRNIACSVYFVTSDGKCAKPFGTDKLFSGRDSGYRRIWQPTVF